MASPADGSQMGDFLFVSIVVVNVNNDILVIIVIVVVAAVVTTITAWPLNKSSALTSRYLSPPLPSLHIADVLQNVNKANNI